MQTEAALLSNLEKNSATTEVQVIFDRGSQRTYVNEALCKTGLELMIRDSQNSHFSRFFSRKMISSK